MRLHRSPSTEVRKPCVLRARRARNVLPPSRPFLAANVAWFGFGENDRATQDDGEV